MTFHRRLAAALVLLSVAAAITAQATPRIQRSFGTTYPAAKEKLGACATCHTDKVPALNPYGADLKKAGLAFAATEALDSDKDGVKNLAEIKALTAPGDPKSKPGAKPAAPDSGKAAPPDSGKAAPDTTKKG